MLRSFFGILLKLNKFFMLYKILMELCNALNIPFVFIGFISTCAILNFVISKLRKKDEAPADTKIETDVKFLQDGFLANNFSKHSCLLKRISSQMADDRTRLEQTLYRDQSSLHKLLLEGIESKLLDSFYKTLKQKDGIQCQDAEEIKRSLTLLQSDIITVKNQLKGESAPLLTKVLENGLVEQIKEEIFTPELLDKVVAVSKETILKLESEAKTKGKEIIQSISRFIDQRQKDIQKELDVFSSAAERSEKDRNKSSNVSLISKVENIEKHLLDTFVVLNRQRFEMENLQKILNHFDGKFNYVATKFDAYWNQKKSAYDNAAKRLDSSRSTWISISKLMDNSSSCLIKQSKNLSTVVAGMQQILKANEQDGFFSLGLKLSTNRLNDNRDNTEIPLVRSIEYFNTKFEDVILISEKAKDKLSIIAKSSDDLDRFQDLMISILDGYNTFFKFFPPSFNQSASDEASSDFHRKIRSEGSKDLANSLQAVRDINGGKATDDGLWQEVGEELNKEYQGTDITNKVICVLKDVMKSALCRLSHENTACETIEKDENDCKENIGNELQEYPQDESLLCDESSNCLIHSSDDSEPESMVTCIEIDQS